MIEVTINDPIALDDRREQFKIAVDYVHGDADAYSTETFFVKYSNMSELEVLIRCLEFMSDRVYSEMSNAREQRAAAAAFASSQTENIELYSRTLENLRQHDTTDGSFQYYASIEDFKVTYFDSKNVEHEVTYELKGEQT